MPPKNGDAGLASAPAVMAWRRVSGLEHADNFANKVAGFPKVGENQYANIYDGGTALVGYWNHDKFVDVLAKEQGTTVDRLAAVASASGCGGKSLDRLSLVSNPANQLTVSGPDFQGAVTRLGRTFKVSPSVTKTPLGDTVSFVDEDGNFSGLYKPGGAGLPARVGTKLRTLLSTNVGGGGGRGGRKAKNRGRVVAYEILVSDLKESQDFYGNTLGLKALGGSRTHVTFDLGSMVLTVRLETALGLVRSLQRAKRLEADWLMFHVNNIEESVKALKRRGVAFPKGIEESAHGRGALFQGPDGHVMNVWQPPPALGNVESEHAGAAKKGKGGRRAARASTDIDYFPALQRILQQNA